MTGALDLPDEGHIMLIHGQQFFIDAVTRKEVETFMAAKPGPTEHITVDTLLGEELTVVGYNVGVIFSTSRTLRARDREFGRMMNAERPFGEEE